MLAEKEVFKQRLREILGELLSSRTGAISMSQSHRQELRELLSVLADMEFHSVGTALRIDGARLAIGLIAVIGGRPERYVLIVANSGEVSIQTPTREIIDLGVAI